MTPDRDDAIFVGKSTKPEFLALPLANRHGLVAGATGTGKTITLQVLAEGRQRAGVPVFGADVKGDLSGIAGRAAKPKVAGSARPRAWLRLRARRLPVVFWDVFGEQGHPIRATVAEMGPLLLSRMLELNDTQEGVLNIAFKLADDQGLLLLDFKDLRAMLQSWPRMPTSSPPIRQCQQGHHRHDPAPPADAGAAGGRALLRRAGAAAQGFDADHAGRPRCRQRAGRRQADPDRRGSTPRSCSGCSPSCSRSCPRPAISTSRSSCSSSTRRICCSTTRPRR